MIDGTYTILLKTSVGEKRGNITFKSKANVLNGYIQVGPRKTLIEPGTVNGDSFQFNGKLQTFVIGELSYHCEGKIQDKKISGKVKCDKGTFSFKGIRKS